MAKLDSMFEDIKVGKQELHPKRVTKWIHYSKLKDNNKQYRKGKNGDEQERTRKRAEQLAELIEADGEVLQDLLVRKIDTDEYEIIAGHHRAMACRILAEERGKEQYAFLPCIVRNVSDVRSEFALYSTNGYDNKTDYEIMCELEGMKHLLETYPEEFPEELQHGRMVERLAARMNMKRTTVGEYQQISNNLGKTGMEKFRSGELKKSAAVQLSSLPETEQEKLIDAGITTHKEITEYKAKKKDEQQVPDEDFQLPGQMEMLKDYPETVPDASKTDTSEPNVPDFGTQEFPLLKNMDEREAFIKDYEKWDIWCENTYTEEVFYRYALPDGSAIVVKQYPYTDYWNPGRECIGEKYYLLTPDVKHLKNGETCMTQLKEHLKKIRS